MLYRFQPDYEAKYALTIERADSRDRNTGGRSTGNRDGGRTAGGSGGGGGGGGRVSAPIAGSNQYAGYKGPVGTSNPNTAAAPGSYGLSSDETRQYNAAKTDYANRGFLARAFDFVSPFGVHNVNPQINQPASYAAGQYHVGLNPGSLLGGMAGFAMPGAGMIAGPALGALYGATGAHDIVLGGPGSGFSTSYPGGGPGYNSTTGYAGPNGPGTTQGAGRPTESGSTQLQNLAQLNQGISGNPGAPQLASGSGQGPATPTGPNYAQMMASIRNVTPGYSISLPGYQYSGTTGAQRAFGRNTATI